MSSAESTLGVDGATRPPAIGPIAPERLPLIAVTVAVSSWGLGNVLVKLISLDGIVLSLYRLWMAVLVMLIIMSVAHVTFTLRGFRRALPAGALFGVNVAMFFSALKLTSVADVTLIQALQPALVLVVAGRWFGERVTASRIAWTAVALAGVAIVVLGSANTPEWSPLGDGLAFGAVGTFTGYFLISKRVSAQISAIEYVAAVQLSAAIVVTPIALASGQDFGPGTPMDWVWLTLIVCITGVGGHLLVNWAHRYVNVSVSSLMMLGVPVIGAVAAWIVLDESLGPVQVAGGLLTLGALAAVVRSGGGLMDRAVEPVVVPG